MAGDWIEFVNVPGTDKVECPICGKRVGHQRMARGAHAAWHKRAEGGGYRTYEAVLTREPSEDPQLCLLVEVDR